MAVSWRRKGDSFPCLSRLQDSGDDTIVLLRTLSKEHITNL